MNSASIFERAHSLVAAAEECLRTAHSLIDVNVDAAHPSLVIVGSACDAAELARQVLDIELKFETNNVIPLRTADDDPLPHHLWTDACLQASIDVDTECYFEWLASTGHWCTATDTRAAMDVLACESMLAAS